MRRRKTASHPSSSFLSSLRLRDLRSLLSLRDSSLFKLFNSHSNLLITSTFCGSLLARDKEARKSQARPLASSGAGQNEEQGDLSCTNSLFFQARQSHQNQPPSLNSTLHSSQPQHPIIHPSSALRFQKIPLPGFNLFISKVISSDRIHCSLLAYTSHIEDRAAFGYTSLFVSIDLFHRRATSSTRLRYFINYLTNRFPSAIIYL